MGRLKTLTVSAAVHDGSDEQRYELLRALCETHGVGEAQTVPRVDFAHGPLFVHGDLTIEGDLVVPDAGVLFVLGTLVVEGHLDAGEASVVAAKNLTFRNGLSEGELLVLETLDAGDKLYLAGNAFSCRAKRCVVNTLVDFERANVFLKVDAQTHVRTWSFPDAAAALGVSEDLSRSFRAWLKNPQPAPVRALTEDTLYDAARTSLEKLNHALAMKSWGETELSMALVYAARFGQPGCVSSLLEHGAVDSQHRALMASVGSLAVLKSFVTDVNARPDGRPLLHLTESEAVVRWLCERGADVDAVDAAGVTALHIAVFHGRVNVATALLDCGARGDLETHAATFRTNIGETAQALAARLATQGPAWEQLATLLR